MYVLYLKKVEAVVADVGEPGVDGGIADSSEALNY